MLPARNLTESAVASTNRITLGRILNIVIICLIVGFGLSIFGLEGKDVWLAVWGFVQDIWRWLEGAAGWAVPYIAAGAIIVIPIVLIRMLWRKFR